MDADERDICIFLKSWLGQYVSGREIARRAGGKWRYRKDPNWATPVLHRLFEKGILDADSTGHFRLRKSEKKEKWVSPEIQKILEQSGKNFAEPFMVDAEEEESAP
jgi:hypothetical protein